MFSLVFQLFFSISLIRFEGFPPSFHVRFLPNRQLPCSAELASKKESNCNVIVRKLTNHMISISEHSHNLLTWSTHIILTRNLQTSSWQSSHHQYQHPHHHSHIMTVFWSLICYICTTSTSWFSHHCNTRFQPIMGLEQVLGDLPGRLLPDQRLSRF